MTQSLIVDLHEHIRSDTIICIIYYKSSLLYFLVYLCFFYIYFIFIMMIKTITLLLSHVLGVRIVLKMIVLRIIRGSLTLIFSLVHVN